MEHAARIRERNESGIVMIRKFFIEQQFEHPPFTLQAFLAVLDRVSALLQDPEKEVVFLCQYPALAECS
jgi:hypothetical protein